MMQSCSFISNLYFSFMYEIMFNDRKNFKSLYFKLKYLINMNWTKGILVTSFRNELKDVT